MKSQFRGAALCGELHQAGDETGVVLRDGVPHRDTHSSISSTASFKREFFGATTRQGGQGADGDSGLSDEKTANGLSNIQRSIESLTAEAEENHVPDVLGLSVDFASKVYQNMTGASSLGPST